MTKIFRGATALAVLTVGYFSATAKAASLNLSPSPPDVFSNWVQASYTYSSGTGILQASGYAYSLDGASLTPGSGWLLGSFTLNATFSIDGTGITPTSGLISVTDSSGTHNYFNSTHLQKFGYSDNSIDDPQILEFIFGPGTGDYGTSNQIGVIFVSKFHNYTSDFNADFDNLYNYSYVYSTADTFAVPVPLPNAAYMGVVGLTLLPLTLRRRRLV